MLENIAEQLLCQEGKTMSELLGIPVHHLITSIVESRYLKSLNKAKDQCFRIWMEWKYRIEWDQEMEKDKSS